MKLKWLGHSCFLLTNESGTRLLTDPYENRIGYAMPAVSADIVTTSHQHGDHNNVSAVTGNYTHIKTSGDFLIKDIGIKGFEVFHDGENGTKRGKNIIYSILIDGLNICHCGDLGHVLSEEQVQSLGKVDILLLPIGGTYTIDAMSACEVMRQIKPEITIPMHFKTDVLNFSIDGVNNFLARAGGGEMVGKQELEFTRENLGKYTSILVLNYK